MHSTEQRRPRATTFFFYQEFNHRSHHLKTQLLLGGLKCLASLFQYLASSYKAKDLRMLAAGVLRWLDVSLAGSVTASVLRQPAKVGCWQVRTGS